MLNKELEAPFIMLFPEQEGSENIKDDKPFRLGGWFLHEYGYNTGYNSELS